VAFEELFPPVASVTHNHCLDMLGKASNETTVRPRRPRHARTWILLFLLYTRLGAMPEQLQRENLSLIGC
jgi:hypothetical protein